MRIRMGMIVAGVFGLSALILDAIGSHALSKWIVLSVDEMAVVQHAWQTATRYQLIHALLILFFTQMAAKERQWNQMAGFLLASMGVLLFCGGIYAKILTGNPTWGKIAPFGGTCLMLSWSCLFVAACRKNNR